MGQGPRTQYIMYGAILAANMTRRRTIFALLVLVALTLFVQLNIRFWGSSAIIPRKWPNLGMTKTSGSGVLHYSNRTFTAPDQFVLFGDSITQLANSQEHGFSFSSALQDAYIRRLDVVNRGLSGYNTSWALDLLPEVLAPPQHAKIRLMTVWFGANDACLPGNNQHVAPDQFHRNLITIITHPVVKAHKPRIILITPPPVCEYAMANVGLQGRTAENTKIYADIVLKVGKELSVLDLVVLDIWTCLMEKAGWQPGSTLPGSKKLEKSWALSQFLSDGLHLTPTAYKIVYEELQRSIRDNWPDQLPEMLPFVSPTWEQKAGDKA